MPTPYASGFTSQPAHEDPVPLRVIGKLPDWLYGTLVRNGPGQFEVGAHSYRHWFDGLALLHAFNLQGGKVHYHSRYLQSNVYRQDNAEGRLHFRGFAVDPCRSLFARIMSLFVPEPTGHNAVVSVERIAGRYVAMTEVPIAVAFDPQTLATVGVVDEQDAELTGQVTTAHPHYDPLRRLGVNYLLQFGRRMRYHLYGIERHGARRRLATLPAQPPAYMHSFAMTERYIILVEFGLRLPNPFSVLLSGRPFIENYVWQPDAPTRFHIIDKDTGEEVATAEAEAVFAFHHINAFERGDELVLDIATYPDSSVIRTLRLDHLREDPAGIPVGAFTRYSVPLQGGYARRERVISETVELPRLNYARSNGRPYRFVYGASQRAGQPGFLDQLIKVDVEAGTAMTWHEPGCYPSEPVFIAAPRGTQEDDGVLLSVVLDAEQERSFLLVQDARTFREIGRAQAPGAVPFGFHGQYFPAE